MGEVWRAVDLILARPVAVKLLRPEYAQHEDDLARFRAEARNVGSVAHPGIAQVYDYYETSSPGRHGATGSPNLDRATGSLGQDCATDPLGQDDATALPGQDQATLPPGQPYLVMELVDGTSLAPMLASGTLSLAWTLSIVAQAARALHAAHVAGLVHRDIKPGNLLVSRQGQVKITDFGIACEAGSAPVTRTGSMICTPVT